MKIFVSWSGVRSHYIAEKLHWWIPNVIQAAQPFISSTDIRKGTRGGFVIAENLETTNVGIVCLTPENRQAPWILFEAGALSKVKTSYLCTVLHELEPSDVEPPIGDFQHTKFNAKDMRKLVGSINLALPEDRRLPDGKLTESFDMWWPRLEAELRAYPATEPTGCKHP